MAGSGDGWGQGHAEGEAGPLLGGGDADSATMGAGDLGGDEQAEAEALLVGPDGAAGEGLEQFCLNITLTELCNMRSIIILLDVVITTDAPGCSRITIGRLPIWSR